MDITMPVMDGYDATIAIWKLYDELAEKPEYAHLVKPVILALTAQQNTSVMEKCVSLGMNGLIHKPVNKKAIQQYLAQFFPDKE